MRRLRYAPARSVAWWRPILAFTSSDGTRERPNVPKWQGVPWGVWTDSGRMTRWLSSRARSAAAWRGLWRMQ
jgi:hypothetical protein